MMIPVRCFSCGGVVAAAHEEYLAFMEGGMASKEALDATGLKRFCCRRMLVSYVPVIKDAAPYE
jgi:DNA-directed RNA polymerase subunit N